MGGTGGGGGGCRYLLDHCIIPPQSLSQREGAELQVVRSGPQPSANLRQHAGIEKKEEEEKKEAFLQQLLTVSSGQKIL